MKETFVLTACCSLSHQATLFITCQISGALSYLESRQLVHRDVSTRNCLVFNDYMIKLTDIAMASPMYSTYYFTEAYLPIRWMSPELLQVCFTFSRVRRFLQASFSLSLSTPEWWQCLFSQV